MMKKRLPEGRIKIKWRDPWVSVLEGLLARGGSDLSKAVLAAYRMGARFDGWTDSFDFDIWKRALAGNGIDIAGQLGARSRGETLPWDHVNAGVSRAFLESECDRAGSGDLTADCREGDCSDCGACGDRPRPGPLTAESVPAPRRVSEPPAAMVSMRFRVKFAKLGPMRLTSHLDVTRAVQRGMRRAGIAVAYSQGFSPHPRIAFGPPLPLGETGEEEYFDVLLAEAPGEGWLERLNECMPHGLEALEGNLIEKSAQSLMASVNSAAYSIRLWSEDAGLLAEQAGVLKQAMEASGNLIDFDAGEVENGKTEIAATMRLKGKGVRPDKVLSEHLATGALGLKVIRKALFVDKAGTLYSPLTGFRARIK
jgi:uncharacterized protein (DUF2344 family)